MNYTFQKRSSLLVVFTLIFISTLQAQDQEKPAQLTDLQVGAEIQWYPAGWIIGPVMNYYLSPKHILNFRLGVNLINRRDWSGLNDDEKGTGFGGSAGYRYLFKPLKNSVFVGARVDLWSSNIKWMNDIGTPQETSGTTKILVLQPTAEVGYWIRFRKTNWSMVLSGGIGQEINIKTDGKEVGQGGMWLLGVSGYYSF